MRTRLSIMIIIIATVLLSACAPSDAEIQRAIAKTQTAQVILPTLSIPTQTPTAELVLGVIDDDLGNILPSADDLIKLGYKTWESKYGSSENTNEDIMTDADYDEDDRTEIFDYGRVTEFYEFHSDNTNPNRELFINLRVYKTVDGAHDAWLNEVEPLISDGENVRRDIDLGEYSAYYEFSYDDSSYYVVEFLNKNVLVNTVAWNTRTDASLSKLTEDLARLIFNKLQTTNIVDPATASFANMVNIEPERDETRTKKTYGYYLVGSEIAPGTWRNNGNNDSCYWEITDRSGDIIENEFGMGGGTMYIPSNAFQVELDEDCGDWTYLD